MKSFKITIFALALVSGLVSSCKKDSTTEPTPTPTPTPTVNTTPNITGADGVLAAVQTKSVQTIGGFTIPIYIGTGVGVFWSTPNSYLDAGTISLNSNSLTKGSNNAYSFQPGTTNPTGIDFSANSYNVSWNVSGNSGNGIPAISRTITMGFPDIDSVQSSATISHSADFTLQCPSVSNADSVMFFIAGSSATLTYTAGPGVNSHTFSASQMGTLGTGTCILEIVPYNYTSFTEGGKSIYYINETAVTKMVTVN
jgi:hypothetical protein